MKRGGDRRNKRQESTSSVKKSDALNRKLWKTEENLDEVNKGRDNITERKKEGGECKRYVEKVVRSEITFKKKKKKGLLEIMRAQKRTS